MSFQYPIARRDETVSEDYHGVKISDPYRWLEDPEAEDTKEFVKNQNNVTIPYLESCPDRNNVKERLTQLWNYAKYSCPYRYGNKYFFYKNTGLQNQSVLYVQDSLDSEAKVFFDPNTLSEDGTIAVSGTSFSEDGNFFAYGLSSSGSDWITINFIDVGTEQKLPDVLKKVKFSHISWTHDHKGIFYAYYADETKADGSETDSNHHQKLYYHRIGTSQDDDILSVEFPEDPLLRITTEISDCGRYLILTPVKGCRNNLVYYSDLSAHENIDSRLTVVEVVKEMEADYEFICNEGSFCVFRTNYKTPNYCLIGIDLMKPEKSNWVTIVPEDEKDVLDWASAVNKNQLVLCYVHDVKSILKLHKITGEKIMDFPLDMGTVTSFSGKKKYSEIFYQFTSFLIPDIIYRCELSEDPIVPTVFRQTHVEGFNPDLFTTKQIFYSSKDGTKIPMFIVSQKNIIQDGSSPCLLYGYGGFNISVQPSFSVTRLTFIQRLNGTLAIANIRGGGEYGEKWHEGGRFHNKQNVFDDFQAAAEYLINEKYTCSKLLTIQGASNGGLLIAACINQRPELFGAAIIHVGVLDMLRYHKFTIGYAWVTDYGSSENEEYFKTLLKYSPLHNVFVPGENGKVQYPATLLLTADHDDRVVPLHSLKFIAQLHHCIAKSNQQKNPVMIRIESNAGHGSGKPTVKLIDEATDIICFIIKSLGVKFMA